MTKTHRSIAAAGCFTLAAAAGLIHAGFSLYWAFGGTVLLETVGGWATTLQHEEPAGFAMRFAIIGTVKILASCLPLLLLSGRLRLRRTLRTISFIGAALLILMSLWTIVTGTLVLSGRRALAEGATDASTLWTTVLWHPLFLIWGTALLAALLLSRAEVSSGLRSANGSPAYADES